MVIMVVSEVIEAEEAVEIKQVALLKANRQVVAEEAQVSFPAHTISSQPPLDI